MTKSISVLIPNYNRETIIGSVIQHLLDQVRQPDEIIVVDDASTDNSIEILKTLPVQLIVQSTNRGPSIARNTAFEASKGDIVLFIDSDSFAAPDLIQKIMDAYCESSDSSLGGVGGRGIESIGKNVYDIWRSRHASQDYGPYRKNNVQYLFGLCCSYRRDVFREVGGFDPYFRVNSGEDLDLGLRINRAGYRLEYIPDAVIYHHHADTRESLLRVQYNWTYWNLVALARNRLPLLRSIIGVFYNYIKYSFQDLQHRRRNELIELNTLIFLRKLTALRDFFFS